MIFPSAPITYFKIETFFIMFCYSIEIFIDNDHTYNDEMYACHECCSCFHGISYFVLNHVGISLDSKLNDFFS